MKINLGNQSDTWKVSKEEFSDITSIKRDESIIKDDRIVANVFDRYLISSIAELNEITIRGKYVFRRN